MRGGGVRRGALKGKQGVGDPIRMGMGIVVVSIPEGWRQNGGEIEVNGGK
jgi:hypothetical protein